MAWIEVHQSLMRHPKTITGAEMLGISRVELVGHLVFLWCWALDFADKEGCLGTNTSSRMIAEAAGFPVKKSEKFTQTLLNCGGEKEGFLEVQAGIFYLHDWIDYAGILVEERGFTREQRRLGGKNRMGKLSSDERKMLAQQASDARWHLAKNASYRTQPNPTQPDPTQPNQVLPPCSPPSAAVIQKEKIEKAISSGEPGSDNQGEVLDKSALEPGKDNGAESPVAGVDPAEAEEPGMDNSADTAAVDREQDPNLTAIAICYESNIGILTPLIADELKEISEKYKAEWFQEAVKEACNAGARKLNYIVKILERWSVDGFKAPLKNSRHKRHPSWDTDPDRFTKGPYGHLVQR